MVEANLVSLPVVEHFDVFEQDRSKLRAGEVFPSAVDVSKIAFECGPARFHRGVIKTITDRTERCFDVVVVEPVRELESRILRAVVLMRNELVAWVPASRCCEASGEACDPTELKSSTLAQVETKQAVTSEVVMSESETCLLYTSPSPRDS